MCERETENEKMPRKVKERKKEGGSIVNQANDRELKGKRRSTHRMFSR